ncbi:hypothetical protein Dimus_007355 [Dionaea muscipula]
MTEIPEKSTPTIPSDMPVLDEIPLAVDRRFQRAPVPPTDSEKTETDEEFEILEVRKGKPMGSRRSNRVASQGPLQRKNVVEKESVKKSEKKKMNEKQKKKVEEKVPDHKEPRSKHKHNKDAKEEELLSEMLKKAKMTKRAARECEELRQQAKRKGDSRGVDPSVEKKQKTEKKKEEKKKEKENVIPRFGKRDTSSFMDLTYMDHLMARRLVNLPRVMMRHMSYVISMKDHESPHGDWLTLVFEAFGVPLVIKKGEEPKKYDFFEDTFLTMCKPTQREWSLVDRKWRERRRDEDIDVPAEEEAEKEEENETGFDLEAVIDEAATEGESGSERSFMMPRIRIKALRKYKKRFQELLHLHSRQKIKNLRESTLGSYWQRS